MRFRCCLSCAARRAAGPTHQDFRTIRTCTPDPGKDWVRRIPRRLTDAGEEVHLTSVAEFLLGGSGRRRLNEFSKTSSSIGETPGRKLNAKCLQRSKDLVTWGRVHASLSRTEVTHYMPTGKAPPPRRATGVRLPRKRAIAANPGRWDCRCERTRPSRGDFVSE